MLVACGLDRLLGDPRWCPHPVVLMGWWISRLRCWAEAWAGDRPGPLRLAGFAITLLLVGGSALVGWGVERLAVTTWRAGSPWSAAVAAVLCMALASALAGRSLDQAVEQVLALLPTGMARPSSLALVPARRSLAGIVGRDTDTLDQSGILRALTETASENAVDGLFAPLLWMLLGAALWSCGGAAGPGPLALAWGFKAASTLDSMLGYRQGRLRWLGTAGARLDDLLVWLPCRLVAFSLPLLGGHGPRGCWRLGRLALAEGAPDPSPNAGVSQAAFALAAGVQLGGLNHYGGMARAKPVLAAGQAPPDAAAVRKVLQLIRQLEWLWLGIALAAATIITKALS